MRTKITVLSFALFMIFGTAHHSSAGCIEACLLPTASPTLVATKQSRKGIVSQTHNQARFDRSYKFETVRQGKTTTMLVTSEQPTLPGWEVKCTCSNGTCFPSQVSNNMVECVSHPGQCDAGCGMTIITLPPPPPPS